MALAEDAEGAGGVVDEDDAWEIGGDCLAGCGIEARDEGAAETDATNESIEEFMLSPARAGEVGFDRLAYWVIMAGVGGDDDLGLATRGGVAAGEFVDDGHDGAAGGGGIVVAWSWNVDVGGGHF